MDSGTTGRGADLITSVDMISTSYLLAIDVVLNRDGAEGNGQSAGATGLDQVNLLVVVDVEVFEGVDRTTLISANGVVSQVDDKTDKGAALGAVDILHLGNGNDAGHTQLAGQSSLISVQRMANLVLQQKHVGQHILGSEEGGIARALVVLTRLDDSPNGRLGTSVGIISTLDCDLALDSEQVIIVVDGTDAALIDLVIAGCQAAVTDQNRTGQLLIQLGAHLLLQPGHNIEAGDVNDVITIHPLLLVHGGGSGRTLQQTEDLLLLEVALDVTLGPSVILGQVGEHGPEAAEGNMMDAVHDGGNPALIVVDDPRGSIQGTVLGEQPLDIIDAMRQERITHGAIALGIGNGSLNVLIGDAVLQAGVRGIVFEHVVRHVSILLVFVTQSLADDGINNLLLLIGQLVEYITHSFLTAGLSGSGLLGIIFSHRGFLLTLGSLIRFGFSVEELEAFAENKRLTV